MTQPVSVFLSILVAALMAATNTLDTRIASLIAKVPATVGVAAIDLDTGRRVSVRGGERFPMGSVFKFPVALAFLHRVDAGEFSLDTSITIQPSEFCPVGRSPIRENAKGQPVTMTYGAILDAMLRDSDNTAADFLLAKVGGPRSVTERLRAIGVQAIRVDRSEREMGHDLGEPGGVARFAVDPRDTATPDGAIELLTRFHRGQDGLSAASHALALKMMTETTTGGNRIKAGVPAGVAVVHRPGTMPGTVNDIGIVTSADGTRHLIIAVLTKASRTEDLDIREHAIAELAKTICDEFWSASPSAPPAPPPQPRD